MKGRVPAFTFVTVPSTPCFGCFAFGDATLVVAPWTPALDCVVGAAAVLVLVVVLDETVVVLEELTFELVFTDELTVVAELAWTDGVVETGGDVLHAAVPALSA